MIRNISISEKIRSVYLEKFGNLTKKQTFLLLILFLLGIKCITLKLLPYTINIGISAVALTVKLLEFKFYIIL